DPAVSFVRDDRTVSAPQWLSSAAGDDRELHVGPYRSGAIAAWVQADGTGQAVRVDAAGAALGAPEPFPASAIEGATDFVRLSDGWPLHYDFAVRFLETEARPMGERRAFMTRNYLRDDRDMIMATIVRFLDEDVWALELGPADTLSGERIASLMDRVRASTWF